MLNHRKKPKAPGDEHRGNQQHVSSCVRVPLYTRFLWSVKTLLTYRESSRFALGPSLGLDSATLQNRHMSPKLVQPCDGKTSPDNYVSPLILQEMLVSQLYGNLYGRTKVLSWTFKIHKRCRASACGRRDEELSIVCSPTSEAGIVTSVALVGLFSSWTWVFGKCPTTLSMIRILDWKDIYFGFRILNYLKHEPLVLQQ